MPKIFKFIFVNHSLDIYYMKIKQNNELTRISNRTIWLHKFFNITEWREWHKKNSLLPNEQLLIDWQTFIHRMIWNIFCDVSSIEGKKPFFLPHFLLYNFACPLSTIIYTYTYIHILCHSFFSLYFVYYYLNLKQYSVGILNYFHYP